MQVKAEFTLDTVNHEPPHDRVGSVALARAHFAKTFTGAIEATSTVEMLSVRGSDHGAGYVAIERIRGTVDGRKGSFVLLHIGTMDDESRWAKWPIAPGSGTGDLAGISGEGRIDMDEDGQHHFTLTYELPE